MNQPAENRPALAREEIMERATEICRQIEEAIRLIEEMRRGASRFRLPGKELLVLDGAGNALLTLLAEFKLAIFGVVSSTVVWGGYALFQRSDASSEEERARMRELQRIVRDALEELKNLAHADFHTVHASSGAYGINVTHGQNGTVEVDHSRLIFNVQLDAMGLQHQ